LGSDELCRLRFEDIRLDAGRGLDLFLPSSKTDRANQGRQLRVGAWSSYLSFIATLIKRN